MERANGVIFTSIKKYLFDQKKGKWVDELPKVVWSHNTSETRTTKFTPFRLLYGAEAMSPEELKNKSLRAISASEGNEPPDDSDLIELDFLQAASNLNKYQKETTKWRDKKVIKKNISMGDGVLKRKANAENAGKLINYCKEGKYNNSVGYKHQDAYTDEKGRTLYATLYSLVRLSENS